MAKKLNEGKTRPPKPVIKPGRVKKEELSKTKPPRTTKKK